MKEQINWQLIARDYPRAFNEFIPKVIKRPAEDILNVGPSHVVLKDPNGQSTYMDIPDCENLMEEHFKLHEIPWGFHPNILFGVRDTIILRELVIAKEQLAQEREKQIKWKSLLKSYMNHVMDYEGQSFISWGPITHMTQYHFWDAKTLAELENEILNNDWSEQEELKSKKETS